MAEGTKLTRAGFDLLSKALAGAELRYTRVSFGNSEVNGDIIEVSDDDAYELTNLINWKIDLPIVGCVADGNGMATIKFRVKNATVTEGFFIREIGVFALDPDTQKEVLYCYRNEPKNVDYMPSGEGAVVWDMFMNVITVIDKATNITAVIDESILFVTVQEFEEHINSDNPHPKLPHIAGEISVADTIWASDIDRNFHPISTENYRRQLLEGIDFNNPNLDARVTQVENNLANLYAQLKAEMDLGLEANMLLIEDFNDNDCNDMFSVKVSNITENILTVDDFSGIIIGSYYSLLDDNNRELVRVKSVNRISNTIKIILDNAPTHSYNTDKTYLMRSTTTIADNGAKSSGDILAKTIAPADSFSGTMADQTVTFVLENGSHILNTCFTSEGVLKLS